MFIKHEVSKYRFPFKQFCKLLLIKLWYEIWVIHFKGLVVLVTDKIIQSMFCRVNYLHILMSIFNQSKLEIIINWLISINFF